MQFKPLACELSYREAGVNLGELKWNMCSILTIALMSGFSSMSRLLCIMAEQAQQLVGLEMEDLP